MADYGAKEGNASAKRSSGPEPAVRKFTLSCARCRASKLKCDRKEPCIECVKRDLGDLCYREERQPRAKRAKTDHRTKAVSKTNALQTQLTEAEEAAQALERFVDGTSRTTAGPSTVSQSAVSFVAPDYPNVYWSTTNNHHKQDEKLALVQEIVHALPELDIIHLLHEVFVTRCQGPLGNIVHTPTFLKQAEILCSCLGLAPPESRVVALTNILSMDTLACHLLALILALAFHPTPSLLCWSSSPLTLRVEELRASDLWSKTWRSLALRCLHGNMSLFCGSIASLQAIVMLLLDGQEGSLALDAILVTAISGAQKLGLHQLGNARLQVSAPSTSSPEDGSITAMDPPHIRTEVGVRVWWALVMRDWSRGQALGYYSIYPSQFSTRMPLHINDEDLYPTTSTVDRYDCITERPRSEFTMLSYTVHALEIAGFARECVDLRGSLRQAQAVQQQQGIDQGAKIRSHLNKKYEKFLAGLPSHFRLGSSVGLTSTGRLQAIPVHRWMLHQQLWALFLRLHRANLSTQDGRAACQLLAQNVISTQTQIQARCAVCGSLASNEIQLFNAGLVLLLDLLSSSMRKNDDETSSQLSRLMTRDKIRDAIELLRTQSHAKVSAFPQEPQSESTNASIQQRSVAALEVLIKLEEDSSSANEESLVDNLPYSPLGGQTTRLEPRARQSLKDKVMDVVKALQGKALNVTAETEQASPNSISAAEVFMPFTSAIHEFQDIDVLPVLSNDPSCNFWQFLDLTSTQPQTESDSFSPTVGLQSFVDSTAFGTSAGTAPPLIDFETLESADMFSNTEGAFGTHMSPPSFRGDHQI